MNLVIFQKIQSFLMRLIKKVIGKIKDEFGGVIVIEFAGLNSKIYSRKKKKLLVKNIIQQKEWVSRMSLTNSKMFCLMKKLSVQNEKNSK